MEAALETLITSKIKIHVNVSAPVPEYVRTALPSVMPMTTSCSVVEDQLVWIVRLDPHASLLPMMHTLSVVRIRKFSVPIYFLSTVHLAM
jgi:hypothetical protein